MIPQIFRFYFFAAIATLINIISRWVFSNVIEYSFIISVSIAYLVGMIVNYLLNKKYTFKKGPRKLHQEFRTFFIVAVLGLVLTTLFSSVLVYIIGTYFPEIKPEYLETVSHILAVGIVSIYSFLAHKYFTFKKGLRQGLRSIVDNRPDPYFYIDH